MQTRRTSLTHAVLVARTKDTAPQATLSGLTVGIIEGGTHHEATDAAESVDSKAHRHDEGW